MKKYKNIKNVPKAEKVFDSEMLWEAIKCQQSVQINLSSIKKETCVKR